MLLYNSSAIREMDRFSIEKVGIPSLRLMENAATAIAKTLEDEIPERLKGRVVIFSGKGNNGGDGMAVARLLKKSGFSPEVVLLAPPEALSEDANAQFVRLGEAGVKWMGGNPGAGLEAANGLEASDTVIDAILGTGLKSPLRGDLLKVVEAINASAAFVASVDVPSGLSGDFPVPIGPALRADFTLTLAVGKPCLFTPEGEPFAGMVRVLDIGIPPEVSEDKTPVCEAVDEAWATPFFTERGRTCHKGEAGRLLLVAGSVGKSGAAVLAARGALRAGAGLVTIACPEGAQPVIAASLPETMTLPMPQTAEGTLSMDSMAPILDFAMEVSAVGMGPGLGAFAETAALCRELYRSIELPAVVDADALNAFDGRTEELTDHPLPRVLTPHPGEMGRLVMKTPAEVSRERYVLVPEAASRWKATLLLKGYRTIVASPGQPWRMAMSGGPHMAGPGFGDVLTGVISALLARGVPAFDAAALGAWWHGAAADLGAKTLGGYGLLASEAADSLPRIEGRLRRHLQP